MDPIGKFEFRRNLEVSLIAPARAVQLGAGLKPEQDQNPRKVVSGPASMAGPAPLGPSLARVPNDQQQQQLLAAALARVPHLISVRLS